MAETMKDILRDQLNDPDHSLTRAPTTPMIGEEELVTELLAHGEFGSSPEANRRNATACARAILSRLPAAGGQSNNRKEGEANTGLQPAQHNDRPRSDTVSGAASGGVSQSTEWDRALEEAAQVAETEPEFPGEPNEIEISAMEMVGPVENARCACRATKKAIALRIRAMQTSAAAHTRSNAADMEG